MVLSKAGEAVLFDAVVGELDSWCPILEDLAEVSASRTCSRCLSEIKSPRRLVDMAFEQIAGHALVERAKSPGSGGSEQRVQGSNDRVGAWA